MGPVRQALADAGVPKKSRGRSVGVSPDAEVASLSAISFRKNDNGVIPDAVVAIVAAVQGWVLAG